MKPPVLIATAAALIGFASGWLLKPSAEKPATIADQGADTANSNRRSGAHDTKSRARDERPLVLKARGAGEMKADPETSEAHRKFEQSFGDATERSGNARLSRLAEALGLSPEQKETLAVMLANRRDGFRDMKGNGKTQAEMVQAANNAELRFQEEVQKILDPEQVEALAAFQQREKDNDIAARAQRDLADLISQVDLSPSQRDQALEVLSNLSADAAANRPEGWSLMSEAMDVIGGAHVTVLEDMGDIMGDPEAMKDPQELHRRLIEAQRGAMERRLSGLATILTPAQLAQYRANLSARSTFMEQAAPPVKDKR